MSEFGRDWVRRTLTCVLAFAVGLSSLPTQALAEALDQAPEPDMVTLVDGAELEAVVEDDVTDPMTSDADIAGADAAEKGAEEGLEAPAADDGESADVSSQEETPIANVADDAAADDVTADDAAADDAAEPADDSQQTLPTADDQAAAPESDNRASEAASQQDPEQNEAIAPEAAPTDQAEEPAPALTAQAASTIASGTCGTCPWTLDSNGLLTIKSGTLSRYSDWPWRNYGDQITSVVFSGNVVSCPSLYGMFEWCTNLKTVSASSLDTSTATDFDRLFLCCESLTSVDLANWDTSNVTTMDGTFTGCTSLEDLDVSGWDTSSLTNMGGAASMYGTFACCYSLTSLDLSGWDVSHVTSMFGTFNDCTSLQYLNVSGWDTSRVEDASLIFKGTDNIKQLRVGSGWTLEFPNAGGERSKWWSSTTEQWYTKADLDSSRRGVADVYFTDGKASIQEMIINCGSGFTYTGNEIMPVQAVTYGGKDLKRGVDYTVSYEGDNVNVGTCTVVISGAGSYTGSDTRTFSIIPKNIEACDVSLSPTYYAYNGQQQTPTVTIKDGSRTLVNGTDYTVSWQSGRTNAGTYTATITGKGNYDSSTTASYEIRQVYPLVKISSVPDQTYTGQAITPKVEVPFNGSNLIEGTDYTLAYSDNVNVGKATINLTYKGNYGGELWTTFNIVAKSLSSCTARLSTTSYTYDGTAKTPTLTVKDGNKTLVNGTDYTVTWPTGRTSPGTYTVTATGTGNYTGTVTASFTIEDPADSIEVAAIPDMVYTGSAITPTPAVTRNGSRLVNGTDYTLSYTNNVNVGTATITVTLKGSSEVAKRVTFTISPKSLKSSGITITPTDFVYDGAQKTPIVVVKDGNKTLSSSDYTASWLTFMIEGKNMTDVGTYVFTVMGRGNYTDSVSVSYAITPRDLSEVSVAPIADVTYTGKAFTPEPSVTYNDRTLSTNADYAVTYANNTAVGTATVTLTAVDGGNFKGSTSTTFKINKMANTISAAATNETVSFTYSTTATTTAKNVTVSNAVGKVTYTNASTNATAKKFTVNSSKGTVVVPAKTVGGTYPVKVKVTAAGDATHASKSVTVTYNITVVKLANTVTAKAAKASVGATYNAGANVSTACNVTVLKPVGAVTYVNASTNTTAKTFTVGKTTGKVVVPKGTKVGTYAVRVKVTAAGSSIRKAKSVTVGYKIVVKARSVAKATVTRPSYAETGSAITAAPKVTIGTVTLKKGTDYTLSGARKTAPGTYTATITGKGNYTGTVKTTFKIKPSVAFCKIKYSRTKTTATLSKVVYRPDTKNVTLVKGTHYTVTTAKVSGGVKVTITGKGAYCGKVTFLMAYAK